jgi:glycosyltransferase involved in cell wall biosynthesis
MKILFIVQGLFEKSDSIGFDCVYQYGLLRDHYNEDVDIRLFAERADLQRYSGIPIEPINQLHTHFSDPNAILIYHFCDGWPSLENSLKDFNGRVIIRWHNNTPPWFFGSYSQRSVERTITGFRTIQGLARDSRYLLMCNSNYTREQLNILAGHDVQNASVVYPASRYLEYREGFSKGLANERNDRVPRPLELLFVGRVVAHKGHRHVLLVAQELQRIAKRPVIVTFAGRSDGAAQGYVDEIRQSAAAVGIDLRLPGEVSDDDLERLYEETYAFVCMSEHEGFGLPVYEAMARQVPVVVWANTAFKEILGEHPLAFTRPHHTDIAHAIISLEDPQRRGRILAYQRQHILPQYSRATVLAQLLAAIAHARDHLRLVNGRTVDHRILAIPTEISDNLVTDYDLSSYDVLLQKIARGVFGQWERQFIRASQFLTKEGFISTDPYVCSDLTSQTQVVFGPYISFTPGTYRAEFMMDLTGVDLDRSSGFHFDVAIDNDTILAAVDVPSPHLTRSVSTSLDFQVDVGQTACRIEFRIQPFGFNGKEYGELTFWGVRVTDLSRTTRTLNGRNGHDEDDNLGHVEFLIQCYNRLLGRAIDNIGLSHYLSCLMTGTMSRREVIENIVSSEEARSRHPNGQVGLANGVAHNADA